MSAPTTDQEVVSKFLEYRPNQGLYWAIDRGPARRGTKPHGRGQIRINGVRRYVSHIVWFIHHGYWPSDRKEWIDHKDGNELNDTIENLRVATPSQNNRNRQKIKRDLPLGTYERNGKYVASIQVNRKTIHLGTWDTPELAAAAYEGASRFLHGEFSIFVRNELSQGNGPATVSEM